MMCSTYKTACDWLGSRFPLLESGVHSGTGLVKFQISPWGGMSFSVIENLVYKCFPHYVSVKNTALLSRYPCMTLPLCSHRGKEGGKGRKLSSASYKRCEFIIRTPLTSSKPITSQRPLSPNTLMLGATASAYEHGGDKIQFTAHRNQNLCFGELCKVRLPIVWTSC